jgi:hypothetical protein
MNISKCTVLLLGALLGAAFASRAAADVFGTGATQFTMDFVDVADTGNPADTVVIGNPVGSVNYIYRIARYEVTEQMIDVANTLGGLNISKDTRGPNMPATSVSWNEAARFINWLNTSTNHLPAYKFVSGAFAVWQPGDPGYNPANPFRNKQAQYFLPDLDEWHKAAYYNPSSGGYFPYPASNVAPTPVAGGTAPNSAVYIAAGPAVVNSAGSLSSYGAMAMAGNVWEWQEDEILPGTRLVRGGGWVQMSFVGTGVSSSEATLISGVGVNNLGIRVASHIIAVGVPEPGALGLGAMACFGLLGLRRKRRGI